MKTLILFLLVLPLFMLPSCGDDDAPVAPIYTIEDEEYAVWSATIDSMVVWEKDDFIVLQRGTDGYSLQDSAIAAYLRGQLKVPDDALQDHGLRSAQGATIERKFDITVDYTLLDRQEIEDLLMLDGYEELYRRYPKCNGVTTLSRVGFNSTRNMALVYLSMTPGYLAGSGWAVLLRKISGKWEVTASTIVWVS